jgi:hypothetical protein
LCYEGAYQLSSTPTGWTLNDSQTGTNQNGSVISKVLNSTDISTGSVTLNIGGTYAQTTSIVTYVGATGGIREVDSSRAASNPTTLTASSAVLGTDDAIYCGGLRTASSGAATTSVSRGTLQQQFNDGFYVSAGLYTETLTTAGSYTATFTYTGTSGTNYQAIVIVKGS